MIIGHERVINYLNQKLLNGTPTNAYLFVGAEYIGKKTVALAFARALVRGEKKININDDDSEDNVLLVGAQTHSRDGVVKCKGMGVDVARYIRRECSFSSQQNRRVIVVDDAHRLTAQAQNALLKTLESPPGESVIILVSNCAGDLLATVRSRLESVSFDITDKENISSVAEKLFGDQSLREDSLRLSFGRMGILNRFAHNQTLLEEYLAAEEMWKKLGKLSINEKLDYARKLAGDEISLQWILQLWVLLWRQEIYNRPDDVLRYKLSEQIMIVTDTQRILSQTNANKRMVIEDLLINKIIL